MVHTLRLEGGQAQTYSNNWVKGKRFEEEQADGGDLYMRVRHTTNCLSHGTPSDALRKRSVTRAP